MKKYIIGLTLCFSTLFSVQHAYAASFSDIGDSPYQDAISFVKKENIVSGYADGTFKPFNAMNRAEFMKVLVAKDMPKGYVVEKDCFPDVAMSAWYAPYICYAKAEGVVAGYPDGTFHPENKVTLPEVSKIVATYHNLEVPKAKEGEAWYLPFMKVLEKEGYLPHTLQHVGQQMARDEIVELLWRVINKRHDLGMKRVDELGFEHCRPLRLKEFSGVDMSVLRQEWLGWYNAERAKVGAAPLELQGDLVLTANAWSKRAATRGFIDHKRENNRYYDFFAIRRWFASFGLTFPSKGGSSFGESIAWNVYSRCSNDCTDSLVSAVRSSFTFFAGERGKAYRPHYDMMVNPDYKYMGVDVVLNPTTRKYYLTAHLATEVKREGLSYCIK